jgi:hypothetical protein
MGMTIWVVIDAEDIHKGNDPYINIDDMVRECNTKEELESVIIAFNEGGYSSIVDLFNNKDDAVECAQPLADEYNLRVVNQLKLHDKIINNIPTNTRNALLGTTLHYVTSISNRLYIRPVTVTKVTKKYIHFIEAGQTHTDKISLAVLNPTKLDPCYLSRFIISNEHINDISKLLVDKVNDVNVSPSAKPQMSIEVIEYITQYINMHEVPLETI